MPSDPTASPALSDRDVLRRSAERVARMLEKWGPEALPADDNGQVHFARALMDSAAADLRAALAGRDVEEDSTYAD